MPADRPLPVCSVIVPTHGRPGELGTCLAAIANLDFPRELLEVVVVDDGGHDSLEAVIAPVRDRVDVALLRQSRQGPAAARNAGASRARGDLLVFTDDDCRPASDWLWQLAQHHVAEPEVALGGHTENELTGSVFSTVSQLIIDAGYARHNGDPSHARFFTSNNLAAATARFRALGGFDARFRTSEDRDLCDRWLAAGWRMRYVPQAIVRHAHRLTFTSFCRQHYAYGRGAFRFHQKHRAREGRRIRLEPSFYVSLHALAFRRCSLGRALLIQLVLLVWHVVNMAGYASEAVRSWGPKGDRVSGEQALRG